MTTAMMLDEITGGIVDGADARHKGLGPGLLESVYERVLARDLQRRGCQVERQKSIALLQQGLQPIVNGLDPSAPPRLRVNQIAGDQ
jgi:iron complex transport system substrate-binding protein